MCVIPALSVHVVISVVTFLGLSRIAGLRAIWVPVRVGCSHGEAGFQVPPGAFRRVAEPGRGTMFGRAIVVPLPHRDPDLAVHLGTRDADEHGQSVIGLARGSVHDAAGVLAAGDDVRVTVRASGLTGCHDCYLSRGSGIADRTAKRPGNVWDSRGARAAWSVARLGVGDGYLR